MCRQNGDMDEVWEASSDEESECGSDVDSDGDSAVGGMESPNKVTATPTIRTVRLDTDKGMTSSVSSTTSLSAATSPTTRPQVQAARPAFTPAALALPSAGPRPQQAGLVALMAHLRKDNDKLRQALVDAQREAEEAVMENEENKNRSEEGGIDFGHLLALAKEFGDGLGGGLAEVGDENDESLSSVQFFSMKTPRVCVQESADGSVQVKSGLGEAVELRRRLEESQNEVQQLRALLAAKEAELAAKDAELAWRCGDSA